MNKWMMTLFASLLLSAPSYAFFGLFDSDEEEEKTDLSALVGSINDQLSTAQNTPLTDLLTSELDISAAQAAGGAGALLSLAQSQLTDSQTSELGALIPGLDSFTSTTGIASMITNMDSVKSTFEGLGIDPGLITQFTPLILQFLTSQGASEGLLGALNGVWM